MSGSVAHRSQIGRGTHAARRAIDIPGDWLPTADNINALPEPLRRYIMHLETRGDPALNLREKIQLQDQVRQLEALLAEAAGEAALKTINGNQRGGGPD